MEPPRLRHGLGLTRGGARSEEPVALEHAPGDVGLDGRKWAELRRPGPLPNKTRVGAITNYGAKTSSTSPKRAYVP